MAEKFISVSSIEEAVSSSSGSADKQKVVITDSTGKIDSSLLPASAGGGSNATSIQNIPVSTTAPTNDQILAFNGTQYVPTNQNTSATSIQNIPVSTTAPTNNQILAFNGTQYVPTNQNTSASTIQCVGGSGRWYTLFSLPNQSSTAILINTLYLTPILVQKSLTFTDVGINVTTSGVSATPDVCIYDENFNLIRDLGNIDASAIGGRFIPISGNITLNPGIYYQGLITNITFSASCFGSQIESFQFLGGTSISVTGASARSFNTTFGTLPNTINPLDVSFTTISPIIYFRLL